MGCCVSSNIKALTSSVAVSQPPKPSEGSFQVEEEKVKEVLSETPKLNVPKTTTKTEPRGKPHQNIMAFDKFKEEESKSKVEKKALSINKGNVTSEICSLRKTMSISRTTAITGQREEGEETRKRVNGSPVKLQKTRSFSGDVGSRRDRSTVHGAPVRLIQCRDQVGQKMGNGECVAGEIPARTLSDGPGHRPRVPTRAMLDPSWVGAHLREERTGLLLQRGPEPRCRRKIAGKWRFRPWRVNGLLVMSHWKIHLCHWNASSLSRILKMSGGGKEVMVAPPSSG